MTEGKDGKLRRKFRILVAPLDWGLGHATRCVPIIKELLGNDCDVWLAGEGLQETLLRSEFSHLPFLHLTGYNIKYSRTSEGLLLKLLLQMPRIISSIKAEHRWLNRTIKAHGFDAVISDNRFGLYHSHVPSVFITHQLSIKNPLGKWNERILQKWNYNYINRFKECWVPDFAGENNLAGELSHPMTMPHVPVKYIDILSRFEKKEEREIKDRLLFILSGPEPQRTILENKIINEVSHYPGTVTIVRGLPGKASILPSTGMIRIYNHLSSEELNKEMGLAEFVISRSGYSTVMDMVSLGKKSILVPTPGQSEQIYLGGYLHEKKIAMAVPQNHFALQSALEKDRKFQYQLPVQPGPSLLEKTVTDFLQSL